MSIRYTDLINAQAPEQVAQVLRNAAQAYRESVIELQSAWQDEQAGRVWDALATILERAAASSDKACDKYLR